MQLQLFENKGDLMIVIKDAPKGTKDQLEKMFADYAITELKGLVKTEDPQPDPNEFQLDAELPNTPDEGFRDVTEDDDVPFETKSDYKNDNIPFNKPEPEKKGYDPFE